jgi:hypothetical protein
VGPRQATTTMRRPGQTWREGGRNGLRRISVPIFRSSRQADPSLVGVKEAASSSVRHLGLGTYALLEAEATDGSLIRSVASMTTGHERIVAQVTVDDSILSVVGANGEVKVARCSARGEPSSAYIRCEARRLPSDRRTSSDYLLSLSLGYVQRLARRINRSEYEVFELKPIKQAQPAAAPSPLPPEPSPAAPPEAA